MSTSTALFTAPRSLSRRAVQMTVRLALPLLLSAAAGCQVPEEGATEVDDAALAGRPKPMLEPERPGSLPSPVVPQQPAPNPTLPPIVMPTNPTPPPQPNYPEQLQWRLSQALSSPGCRYDGDGDCLNDNVERELAEAVNPMQFWDSGEDCAGRKNYYQVRPVGASTPTFPWVRSSSESVDTWSSRPGTYYVTVNYMMAFFKDCNTKIGFINAGHRGDGEQVVLLLSSSDLYGWRLEKMYYAAHGNESKTHDRAYLMRIANDLRAASASKRSVQPWVATDEDGHGSWAGVAANSSKCWPNDDDIGVRDCFNDNMVTDYYYGKYNPLLASNELNNNIGEPGHWNQRVITTSPDGREAWIDHNGQREMLSDPNRPFCGWTCPQRNAFGNCLVPVDGGTVTLNCTSPLYRSVVQSCFRVGNQQVGC